MKKKLVTLCAALALCATAIIGGTLAYFTDNKTATNTFTVGNVEITLTEPKWTDAETAGKHTNVYPGQMLDKDPTVKNIGANACYVRIKVEGLDQFGNKGMITYWTDGENKIGADWEKKGDYFYYKKVLPVGESTSALFDQIQVPTGLTNEDGGADKKVEVKVTAEAVQAEGFDTYTDAWNTVKPTTQP